MLVAATPAADPPPWPDAERPTRGASGPDGDAGLEDRAGSEVASRVEPLSLPAVDVVADGSETDTPAALPDPLDEDLAVGDEPDSRAALRRSSAEAASPSESVKLGAGASTQSKLKVYAQVVRLRVRMERCASLMYGARLVRVEPPPLMHPSQAGKSSLSGQYEAQ